MNPVHSKIPLRVVIYPKDVQNITGLGDRAARKLIQNIKSALGKSGSMFVTVQEFCASTGIPEELIEDFLK